VCAEHRVASAILERRQLGSVTSWTLGFPSSWTTPSSYESDHWSTLFSRPITTYRRSVGGVSVLKMRAVIDEKSALFQSQYDYNFVKETFTSIDW